WTKSSGQVTLTDSATVSGNDHLAASAITAFLKSPSLIRDRASRTWLTSPDGATWNCKVIVPARDGFLAISPRNSSRTPCSWPSIRAAILAGLTASSLAFFTLKPRSWAKKTMLPSARFIARTGRDGSVAAARVGKCFFLRRLGADAETEIDHAEANDAAQNADHAFHAEGPIAMRMISIQCRSPGN